MEKKKLRFNIIDLLIILLVAAVIVVGWKLLSSSGAAQPEQTKEIHYVVRCTEVESAAAEKPEPGADVFNSSTTTYLGVLAESFSEPYAEPLYDPAAGEYRLCEVAGMSNVFLEIEGQGVETDTAISVEGTTVRVGDKVDVKCRGFAATGYIVDIFTDASEWGD